MGRAGNCVLGTGMAGVEDSTLEQAECTHSLEKAGSLACQITVGTEASQ